MVAVRYKNGFKVRDYRV